MGWHEEEPTKLRMLDLFSGLGGASEAMLQSDDWEVIRVENNEELLGHVPRTFIFDVKELAEEERQLVKEIVAKSKGDTNAIRKEIKNLFDFDHTD